MSLSNKIFKNNKTGEVVKVIDSFENIIILENKKKIDASVLLNPELFTEQIDVSSFFNNQNAYNALAEKIKSIPTDRIMDDDGEVKISIEGDSKTIIQPSIQESAIIMTTEEDERMELAKKYGINNKNESIIKQNEAFAKLLGDDSELPITPKIEVTNYEEAPVQRIEVSRESIEENESMPNQVTKDPIIDLFKNVKRTKDFSISIEIKNKIPRPDFIEMMEDSYTTSIIDYLANEFTKGILKNPDIIKNTIKQKIKEIVYGVEKPKIPRKKTIKTPENQPEIKPKAKSKSRKKETPK